MFGETDEVEKLIDASPDSVRAEDEEGWTPLHWAISKGKKDVAELLIARDADVNASDTDGWTPLHVAASWGHADLAKLLIDNGGRREPSRQ